MTSTISGVEQRPNFYEHQYLEAADLTAVVDYSRAQLARTQLGAHRWGIALGLDLREVPGPGNTLDVFVQPGYAWDGFGRAIVVPEPHRIAGALFAAIDGEFVPGNPPRLVEVWIGYTETATKGPRPGFEECEGGPSFARVLESYRVEVGRRATLAAQRDPITIAGRSIDASQALITFDPAAPELDDASVPAPGLPRPGHDRPLVDPDRHGVVGTRQSRPLRRARRSSPSPATCAPASTRGSSPAPIEATGGYVRVHDRAADYSPFFTPDELLWVEGALRVDGGARLYGPNALEFVRSHTEAPRQPFQMLRRDDATGVKLQAVIGEETTGRQSLRRRAQDRRRPRDEPRHPRRDAGGHGRGAGRHRHLDTRCTAARHRRRHPDRHEHRPDRQLPCASERGRTARAARLQRRHGRGNPRCVVHADRAARHRDQRPHTTPAHQR